MVKSLYSLLTVGLGLLLLTGCSSPDEKANKLFVEVFEIVRSAQEAEKTSYSDALNLYEKALLKTEGITTKYPSSTMAVRIVSG